MNNMLAENFEYRHKKFDQERSRSNSWSSSCTGGSAEFSYIKVKTERLDEAAANANQQPVIEDTAALNLSHGKRFRERCYTAMLEEDFHLFPETKRFHLNTLNPALATHSYSRSPVVVTAPAKGKNLKRSYAALHQEDFHLLPEAKRRNMDSCSPALSFYSPTPLTADTTANADAVIPPTAAILPKINHETLHSICKYHGNMVRKFPKKERSPKDQERRNKNTIACRMSRRVKKLEHIAIEEQYKEFSQETFKIIEKTMRATAYFHELMNLTSTNTNTNKYATTTVKEEYPSSNKRIEMSSATTGSKKKPFTIAFLTGNE